MRRLVFEPDDQRQTLPLLVFHAHIRSLHSAVSAAAEQDEAILIKLWPGFYDLELPRPVMFLVSARFEALAQLTDPAPVVVTGDHRSALGAGNLLVAQSADRRRFHRPAKPNRSGSRQYRQRFC